MKFYLLTSNSLEGLIRSTEIIPSKDLVVVINTLDDDYLISAETHCILHDIEYYITESDGTPATGKNSVIDLFLESDNEYMVQLDGDDIITPYGYDLYKSLSQHHNPPDMVVLYRQPQMYSMSLDYMLQLCENLSTLKLADRVKSGLHFPLDKSAPTYQNHYYETYIHYFFMKQKEDLFTAHKWSVNRLEFNRLMDELSEDKEYMCRMVFYSRKIAGHVKFNNDIVVGEDTVQFMKLKRMAQDGKVTILRRAENKKPSYLSIVNDNSITKAHSLNGLDWSWVRPVLNALHTIQDELPIPHQTLPEFIDDTYT